MLYVFDGFCFLIFEWCGGCVFDFDCSDMFEWFGCFIGCIYVVGVMQLYVVCFVFDIGMFGYELCDYLFVYDFILDDVRLVYEIVVVLVFEGVEVVFECVGEICLLCMYGDCYLSNVLWIDVGLYFVDFDDSWMVLVVQDLWLLLLGDCEGVLCVLVDLFVGYEDFCEFELCELYFVEVLCMLWLIYYVVWFVWCWDDLVFLVVFLWFNMYCYWEVCVFELCEQIGVMQEGLFWFV